jgi:hypothetical protein
VLERLIKVSLVVMVELATITLVVAVVVLVP